MAAAYHVKSEGGFRYPISDYLHVGDPTKVSTWTMRMTDSPGRMSKVMLDAAAAALAKGDPMVIKTPVAGAAMAAARAKLRAAYAKLGVAASDLPMVLLEAAPEVEVSSLAIELFLN